MTAPDGKLDATGLLCPLPVLKARKLLQAMQPGQVLEVRATDPMAPLDFAAFCARAGHEIVLNEVSDSVFVMVIQRGDGEASA